MINLQDLTASQLNRIIALREQIETLQSEIESVAGNGGELSAPLVKGKKRRMSAAARKRIAAGARARWARLKAGTTEPKAAKKRDRRSSPAVRAKLAAAARARWAKAKASGQTSL
jgi:hypothetical protein